MSTAKELKKEIERGVWDASLGRLYGRRAGVLERQRARYADALDCFAALYGGEREAAIYSAPGRTEIGGNHTDHNHGVVMAGAVDLDLGALSYVYPGNNRGNTTELYGAAGYGPFTAKYSHTVSKDYFGWAGAKTSSRRGRNTGYLNLAFAQEVLPSVTLKAALGYTRFAGDIRDLGVPNYVDYSLGGAYDFGGGLQLSAAVAGATKKSFFGDANKARLIVTLTKTL